MSDTKRVTVSLPTGVVSDLDAICSRAGISRSALVAQILLEMDLHSLATVISNLPQTPSEGDVKRFRGESRQYVESQLKRLQSLQGGLFDDRD